MKTLFIEARSKAKVELPDEFVKQLPEKIALFTTVQFMSSLEDAKKKLEANGKKVLLLKADHTQYYGQLLGCSIKKFTGDFDAFIYIGDGLFHPKALMLKNTKPVFVFDPLSKQHLKLSENSIAEMKRKSQASLNKFMHSNEIGVLVSTKPGQNNIKKAYELEKRFPDKNFYFLLFDTIDFSELENFPFIQCFINTACPRISYDEAEKIRKAVVNIDDLP